MEDRSIRDAIGEEKKNWKVIRGFVKERRDRGQPWETILETVNPDGKIAPVTRESVTITEGSQTISVLPTNPHLTSISAPFIPDPATISQTTIFPHEITHFSGPISHNLGTLTSQSTFPDPIKNPINQFYQHRYIIPPSDGFNNPGEDNFWEERTHDINPGALAQPAQIPSTDPNDAFLNPQFDISLEHPPGNFGGYIFGSPYDFQPNL